MWCALLLISAAALPAQEASQGLMQYLRDARKAGITFKQAEQNALAAGWSRESVDAAMRTVQGDAAPSGTEKRAAEPAPGGKAVDATEPREPAAPPNATASTGAGGTVPPVKTPAAMDRGVPDDYHIGEGDILHIAVWKEPDASVPSVVVRPDGRISMPMLKEVRVSGMTPVEAEKVITEQLTKFISAPDVTVIVSAINSKKIYVVGGVKKEGPIAYTYRMTVLQALSEAGGLTDYAKKKKIYVLRHENGRDYKLPFDYDAALRGERMELNIPLVSGDTIVVPK